jgi:hypothetical protein
VILGWPKARWRRAGWCRRAEIASRFKTLTRLECRRVARVWWTQLRARLHGAGRSCCFRWTALGGCLRRCRHCVRRRRHHSHRALTGGARSWHCAHCCAIPRAASCAPTSARTRSRGSYQTAIAASNMWCAAVVGAAVCKSAITRRSSSQRCWHFVSALTFSCDIWRAVCFTKFAWEMSGKQTRGERTWRESLSYEATALRDSDQDRQSNGL